jgi:hypothetical protein
LKYKLKLKGLKTPSGTISILALKDLVDTLVETAERGLRLAVQGESVKRGPVPGWLARSLDFTIIELKKGSTTLTLEAPALGETAEEQIRQQEAWHPGLVSGVASATLCGDRPSSNLLPEGEGYG